MKGRTSQHQTPLSAEFVTQQRKHLEALRGQLLGTEENTIARGHITQQEHGDEAEEFEDEAQEMSRQEVNQALRDVDDQRVANIERAKIIDGSFGVSDLSGRLIPRARLESIPEAILTIQEERSQETDQTLETRRPD